MVKHFKPGVVEIELFITQTNVFRAKIHEVGGGPSGNYEVTIGGKEWLGGKGAKWRNEIMQLIGRQVAYIDRERRRIEAIELARVEEKPYAHAQR